MNALRKQREWTPAQRADQSRALRDRQIWLKSTGPRTEQGKAASSRNARHADYEYRQAQRTEMRLIMAYLRTQKSYTDLLKLFSKQGDNITSHRYYAINYQLFFLENELRDIERNMFGGLLFSEVIGAENRHNQDNALPFCRT
jgi:hypothetical protein